MIELGAVESSGVLAELTESAGCHCGYTALLLYCVFASVRGASFLGCRGCRVWRAYLGFVQPRNDLSGLESLRLLQLGKLLVHVRSTCTP